MPKPKYTALGQIAVIIGAFVTGVGAFVSGVGLILAHAAGAFIEFVEMIAEYIGPKITRLFVIEEYEPEWCQSLDPEDIFVYEPWQKEVGPALLMVWLSMDGDYWASSTVIATGERKVVFLTAKNIDDAKKEAENAFKE